LFRRVDPFGEKEHAEAAGGNAPLVEEFNAVQESSVDGLKATLVDGHGEVT